MQKKRVNAVASLLGAVAIQLVVGGVAQAEIVVITPKTATSTTEYSFLFNAFYIIDGSGLTGWGQGGDITTKTHAQLNAVNYWESAATALPANGTTSTTEVITFALREPSTVDRIHHWPYYNAGFNARGIKTCDISFSTDGGATYPTTIPAATLGNFTAPTGAPFPAQTKTFTPQAGVTHIMMSNLVVFGYLGGYIQVAEIRFGGPGNLDQARGVDVVNPSFEFQYLGATSFSTNNPCGWGGADSFTGNHTLGDFTASDGKQVMGFRTNGVNAAYQMLGESIRPGTYTLTVDAGLRGTDNTETVTAALYVTSLTNVVASYTADTLPVNPVTTWRKLTVEYAVAANDRNIGKQLGIKLSRDNGTQQAILDNVTLAYTNAMGNILVQNASFETPVLNSGTYTATVSGWMKSDADAFTIHQNIPTSPSASDGTQMASVASGILSQTLPRNFIANMVYTLTVDAAQRGAGSTGAVVLYAERDGGVRTPLATATDAALPVNPAADGWHAMTVKYTVSPGDPHIGSRVGVELKRTAGTAEQVTFDNVRMTLTAAPPQGTIILVY